MKLPGYKKRRREYVAPDISTPQGRHQAEKELTFGDHGFLREAFQNLHQISDEMWRANQPNPRQVAEHKRERGIKTIINLRGEAPRGHYVLEKEACDQEGITLVDFQVHSRDVPTPETVLAAKELFETIEYPALMHCKSGADRAGLMATLYMIFRQGRSVEYAVQQLSKKYLHFKEGKTGLLDAFFQTYLDINQDDRPDFEAWVKAGYDRDAIKQAFQESGKDKLAIDKLLRRE